MTIQVVFPELNYQVRIYTDDEFIDYFGRISLIYDDDKDCRKKYFYDEKSKSIVDRDRLDCDDEIEETAMIYKNVSPQEAKKILVDLAADWTIKKTRLYVARNPEEAQQVTSALKKRLNELEPIVTEVRQKHDELFEQAHQKGDWNLMKQFPDISYNEDWDEYDCIDDAIEILKSTR